MSPSTQSSLGPSQVRRPRLSLSRRTFLSRKSRWALPRPASTQAPSATQRSLGAGLAAQCYAQTAVEAGAADSAQDTSTARLESVAGWLGAAPQQLLPATRSVASLAAAWDQLAPRLPLAVGMGQGSELILNALKLALAATAGADGAGGAAAHPSWQHAERALGVALRLADLASEGLPLDAEAIAAGILAEALCRGGGGALAPAPAGSALQLVEARVGPGVAHLLHDVLRVRALPSRVDLYDDEAASALRELCLSFYDTRATAVEVAARLEGLAWLGGAGAPRYERQVAALEALQIYAPMGHALGMGRLSAQLEDACFQALFPESYARTAAWLRHESAASQAALDACQAALRCAVLDAPAFCKLAAGLRLQGRTKSLFSTLKKLLRLGASGRGGRSRAEIYDLMGIRAIVQPRGDLPEEEAEAAAVQACYLVREVLESLWEVVPGRCKDYIASPKENGYQSLHTTVRVRGGDAAALGADAAKAAGHSSSSSSSAAGWCGGGTCTLELQIRTQAMHDRAEAGPAAHAAYKGGLAPGQVRQLRAWTDARRLLATSLSTKQQQQQQEGQGEPQQQQEQQQRWGTAAAEVLFSHLDRNGDGRLSLGELAEALAELGAGAQGAEELMALADTDADGSITLPEFLEFHRKAGLMRAISEVDHETAEQLELQVQPTQGAGSVRSSSTGNGGDGNGMAVAAAPAGSWGSTSSSSSSSACAAQPAGAGPSSQQWSGAAPAPALRALRAASPWGAAARRGLLRWAVHNIRSSSAMHVNGSGGGGGLPQRLVSVAASPEVLSSTSASSADVEGAEEAQAQLEEVQPGIIAISSPPQRGSNGNGNGNGKGSSTGNGGSSGGQKGASAVRRPANGAHSGEAQRPLARQVRGSGNGSGNGDSSSSSSSSSVLAEALPPETAAPPQETTAAVPADERGGGGSGGARGGAGAPRGAAGALAEAMRPILRVWQLNRPLPAAAGWRLVPAPGNPHPVTGSVGQPLPAVAMPAHGPCIVGAVRDRDCDVVLDVPTVSGRHARFWVQRRPDTGTSQLFVADVGSTNGTFVNRYRIQPWRDMPLYPGDLVQFAQPDVGFIVRLEPASASAEGTGAQPEAVAAALEVASALEAAAAAGGVFPPPARAEGSGGSVAERARRLIAAGEYVPARMLLLGEAMRHPLDGGLWAQLANLERNLAKHTLPGAPAAGPPSAGTARTFFGAAVACSEAQLGVPAAAAAAATGAAQPAVVQSLCRALSGWAQLEYAQGNERAGRSLFRMALKRAEDLQQQQQGQQEQPAAEQHQQQQQQWEDAPSDGPEGGGEGAGAGAVDVPWLLFAFAHREWKAGAADRAAQLAKQLLALQPRNHYALALLGNIKAEAGKVHAARALFRRALEAQPGYVIALQSWARLEARAGALPRARQLFEQALLVEPGNNFVLQAWAVAEAREGHTAEARALFARCLEADPGCRSALHAWAKLEEGAGDVGRARELYLRVLQLSPRNVVTLSALGRLERLSGRDADAARHLLAALRVNPRSASALSELAALREEEGAQEEASRLRREAQQVNNARRGSLQRVGGRKRRGKQEEDAVDAAAPQAAAPPDQQH